MVEKQSKIGYLIESASPGQYLHEKIEEVTPLFAESTRLSTTVAWQGGLA